MTMKALLSRFLLVVPFLVSLSRSESPVCSLSAEEDGERDPALRQMIYNIGDGEQSTYVYVEPDIASFYRGNPPASTKVSPKHVSLFLFMLVGCAIRTHMKSYITSVERVFGKVYQC